MSMEEWATRQQVILEWEGRIGIVKGLQSLVIGGYKM